MMIMKKVYQDRFGIAGNCFAAAVASVLEIKLSDVPDLMPHELTEGEEQDRILNDWLANYNLKYIEMRVSKECVEKFLDKVYHLIIGSSPRNRNFDHVLVGLGGKVIHDPYPKETAGAAVLGFLKYGIFISIDPFVSLCSTENSSSSIIKVNRFRTSIHYILDSNDVLLQINKTTYRLIRKQVYELYKMLENVLFDKSNFIKKLKSFLFN